MKYLKKYLLLSMVVMQTIYSYAGPNDIIKFADKDVKAICVENWDTNGDGELSEGEAAAVTELGNVFKHNKEITSFEEFRYFIGLNIIYQAFEDCTSLNSITIPNSVTNIDYYAFSDCWSLNSITIPNSVTIIRDNAFYGCSSLTSITIPNSVISIGSAFGGCTSLTSLRVEKNNIKFDSREDCNAIIETETNTLIAGCKNTTIPNSVKAIGYNAFYDCKGLTSVNIPNSVTSIGYGAFNGCVDLASITIPNSVTDISESIFSRCLSLSSINVEKGNTKYDSRDNCNAIIETETDKLIAGCQGTIIPKSITTIGRGAFSYVYQRYTANLAITIPDNIASIESWAFNFDNQSGALIVTVDNPTPINISEYAFIISLYNSILYVPKGAKNAYQTAKGWEKFGKIYERIENDGSYINFADAKVKQICLKNWDKNQDGELSYEEAASVHEMGSLGWSDINSFNEFQYFTGLTSIEGGAFSNCPFLTSIILPNNIKSIAPNAFNGCSSLTSITLPNKLASIGYSAFAYCSSLSSICIPNSVTSIGEYAFSGCKDLISIKVDEGNEIFDSRENCNAIIETATNTLIVGCRNTIIPQSITSIGKYAFWNCDDLTSINIPRNVTTIGEYAFGECDDLTSINIPRNVTTIGRGVFSGCKGLISIKVDEGNEIFDSRENCNAIIKTATNTLIVGCRNTITPQSITSIGECAFRNCDDLTSINIPRNVTTIGEYAFYHCNKLHSVTIPQAVETIEDRAFADCRSLSTVYVGNKNPFSIHENSFEETEVVLYVPLGSKILYENDNNWKKFKEIVDGIRVSANSYTTEYGDEIPAFEYTISPKISELAPEITCNATTKSPAGQYYIVVSSGSFPEGLITAVNGTLTINKAPLTATAKSYKRSVGEQNPNFEIIYEGFKNSETESVLIQKPIITCEATVNSPAGRYPIKLSGGSAQNYELTLVNGELKVNSQHSLIINSLGNGGVSYAGEFVRDFGKIALEDDENVKITFVPDAGYRLSLATLNGNSILPDVKDNTYIIPHIEDDITIVVGFTESEGSFTTNMINYKVLSRTDKTVIVERGWYSGFVTIPTNVTYDSQQWRVVGMRDNAFYDCTELISIELPNTLQESEMGISLFTGCDGLAAMIWKPRFALTNSMLGTADNPNLLFYTSSANYAPAKISNVVVNGRAEKITLKDTRDGNFYCPESFTAASISYTHNYNMESAINGIQGWETIALPFTVQKIEHTKQGVIVPFAKYNNSDINQRPFWLYNYGSNGFSRASVIEANTPYIICMPNNDKYDAEYRLSGDVTFSAENISVASTETVNTKSRGNITFVPAFIGQDKSNKIFALNVNNNMYAATGSYNPGSKFISNLRDISPFEAYMTSSEANVREIIDLEFENATGIEDVPMSRNHLFSSQQRIYNLSGQLLMKADSAEELQSIVRKLPSGIYIINGKKISIE